MLKSFSLPPNPFENDLSTGLFDFATNQARSQEPRFVGNPTESDPALHHRGPWRDTLGLPAFVKLAGKPDQQHAETGEMSQQGAGREDFKGKVGTTARESEPWWPGRPEAPEGAPNVLVIALDDTGFAHLGCYGSDIETPNLDRLAAGGLRYTNFHTTALCSPTRACLLTGRNHHSVGMRFLSNVDTGFSNCRGQITPKAATIAEMLRSTGYNTFALGKWHLANMQDCTAAGPFDQWPLQRGFDRYYGFLGGATDQFSPELTVDNHPIDPPSDPAYHLSEALVDQAMGMITGQRASGAQRPFFMYLAFGATHSPHQAPKAWLDKYKGRYDKGWDQTRAEWFSRQQAMGIVPEGTVLSPRNPGVPAWDSLDEDRRRLYARMQEAFAAFLDHTDVQIGRLVEFLRSIGSLDNTLIVFLSDNGASQEGGHDGVTNELAYFNQLSQSAADMLPQIDAIGGPNLLNNYPKGWAQVGNTPLRFYKQNTYEGGILDPMIVHWPARIRQGGGIRHQYHHVSDITPTILECVGIQAPQVYAGVPQLPIEGTSFAYTFDDAQAPRRKPAQYYEMLGHRALWKDGWKAVALHRQGEDFDKDRWALYHTDVDFSETRDLAEAEPQKLQQMIAAWWAEAGRYNVLPLDDRGVELFVLRKPGKQANPSAIRYLPGTPHIDRFGVPDTRNRSHTISARIERSSTTQQGALIASGSRVGGYALYVLDNRLHYVYNRLGQMRCIRSSIELPAGLCELAARYDKTVEHEGRVTLLVNGQEVGSGEVVQMPWRQSFYGLDVGSDQGSTVSDAYAAPFRFEGRLHHVDFQLGDDRKDLKKAAKVEARNAVADQ